MIPLGVDAYNTDYQGVMSYIGSRSYHLKDPDADGRTDDRTMTIQVAER